ncbi:MAG: hypothetical protein Q9217_002231 [Psora testacea]
MASKLPALVVDVIQLIASALEPTDLFSFRLVCKELNQKTLYHFGRTCLKILRTDLSRNSLQELKDFSGNEQLGSCVQTLLIKSGPHGLGQGFPWHRHSSGYLIHPLSGVQMLQEILLNGLKNCRSFHIHSLICEEDTYDNDGVTPSDAVGIILALIAETGLSVRSFYVDFRKQGTSRMDGKRLHMPRYQTPEFSFAWSHLQELSLEQSMTSENYDKALELVLCATNLRKLSLNLEYDHSCSFIGRVALAGTLHGLQELRLSSVNVTAETISGLLLRSHNSLRALSFRFVYLENDDNWVSILRTLKINHPFLESISVFWLKELKAPEPDNIVFPTLSSNPVVLLDRKFELSYKKYCGEKRVIGASYWGQGMDRALETLAESIEYI